MKQQKKYCTTNISSRRPFSKSQWPDKKGIHQRSYRVLRVTSRRWRFKTWIREADYRTILCSTLRDSSKQSQDPFEVCQNSYQKTQKTQKACVLCSDETTFLPFTQSTRLGRKSTMIITLRSSFPQRSMVMIAS